MNPETGRWQRTLPKLAPGAKHSTSPGFNTNQDSRTQPVSYPTIRGIVGEAISYYKTKNSKPSGSQLHIFSVSFHSAYGQGQPYPNNERSESLSNSESKTDNQNNRYQHPAFQKFIRRHHREIMDNSFLLSKFGNQNKASFKSRNARQVYGQIEKMKRSQRLKMQLNKKYLKQQSSKKNVIEQKTSLAVLNPEQKSQELKLEGNGQQTDKKQTRKQSEESLNFSNSIKCIGGFFSEKQPQSNELQSQKTKEEQTQYRLYATRTNLVEYGGLAKRARAIDYPAGGEKKWKFHLGPGNNSQMIGTVLESRGNWIQTPEHDTLFHLKWEQTTEKNIYNRLNFSRYRQLVNHLLSHEHISTKTGLLETIKYYLQRFQTNSQLKIEESLQCFDLLPITFSLDWDSNTKFEIQLKRFVMYYCENHPDPERAWKKERDYVEFIKSITGEKGRCLNLTMNKSELMRKANIPPLSKIYKSQQNQYLWIIKPSELNRGRGIQIFSSLQDLAKILHNDITCGSFVIQKYIERPMLLEGRKFDIRVWMLVDSEGRAYLFEEGYIRTSSEKFSMEDESRNNQYVHLTNNAVQKMSQNYGAYQDGNQLSFDQFDQFINQPPGFFKETYLTTIKDICSLVVQAGLKKKMLGNLLGTNLKDSPLKVGKDKEKYTSSSETFQIPKVCTAKSTFEIFGLDFMIDEMEKLWLIEVNTNPCIEMSSKFLSTLIPRMLDDAFKKVVDPIFKPRNVPVFPVPGYEDCENMWKILSNEEQEVISRLRSYIQQKSQP